MAFELIFFVGFVGTLLFATLPTQHPTPRRTHSANYAAFRSWHGPMGFSVVVIQICSKNIKNDAKFLRVYGKNDKYTAKPASRAAALVLLFFGYLLNPLVRLQSDLLQAASKPGTP